MADASDHDEPFRPRDRLRSQDRFFLDQEAPGSTMNVGALVTLGGHQHDELRDDVVRLFASTIHLLPRLRQRLCDVPLPGAAPVWVDDPSFDIQERVRLCPLDRPPGRDELLSWAGELVAEPLERDRPLWDVTVVPRTAGGDSALVLRWHHALIDGMSGVEIGKLLLRTSPTTALPPPIPWSPAPLPEPAELVAEALALQAGDSFLTAARSTMSWAEPAPPSTSARDLWKGLSTFGRLGAPPPNPFKPAARGKRRYAKAAVSDAALRAIRQHYHVDVEVAVLAIATGASSRLIRARGQSFDNLRVFVPRTVAFKQRARTLGNHATFNVVDLPLGEMTESERIAVVASRMEAVRHSRQAEAVTTVADVVASTPPLPGTLNRSVARWFGDQNFVHAVVSYIRGPRQPLYLAGRAHRGTCPILPRSNGVGVLFGALSLGGITTFGVVADPAAVPELDFLAAALRSVCAELADPEHPA